MEGKIKYYHEFELLISAISPPEDYKENRGLLMHVKDEYRQMMVRLVTIGCGIVKASMLCNQIGETAKLYNLTLDQVFDAVIKQIK